jgi:hypothetical protein
MASSTLVLPAPSSTFKLNLERLTPLSSCASAALRNGIERSGHHGTWLQVSDLLAMRRNAKHIAKSAALFEAVRPFLTDEESIEVVETTSESFWSIHRKFHWSMLVCSCGMVL